MALKENLGTYEVLNYKPRDCKVMLPEVQRLSALHRPLDCKIRALRGIVCP